MYGMFEDGAHKLIEPNDSGMEESTFLPVLKKTRMPMASGKGKGGDVLG